MAVLFSPKWQQWSKFISYHQNKDYVKNWQWQLHLKLRFKNLSWLDYKCRLTKFRRWLKYCHITMPTCLTFPVCFYGITLWTPLLHCTTQAEWQTQIKVHLKVKITFKQSLCTFNCIHTFTQKQQSMHIEILVVHVSDVDAIVNFAVWLFAARFCVTL